MISQTMEYALRAMTHLASLGDAVGTSEKLAEATQTPHDYLSKVMRDLVRSGLVTSTRGRQGGFALARPASKISVLDIVNAVEPLRRITSCPLGNPSHTQLCPLHRCLDDAMAQIEHAFASNTLSDLVDGTAVPMGCRRLVGVGLAADLKRSENH
jgi:Rrf2 family nitric oxide-sensitive transcriptional repressor